MFYVKDITSNLLFQFYSVIILDLEFNFYSVFCSINKKTYMYRSYKYISQNYRIISSSSLIVESNL